MSISLLIAKALQTRREADISLWRQLCQSFYLRFSASKLDPWEYFFFRVYLDRYSLDDKKSFVGWRREIQLDRSANNNSARNLANNKLASHTLLNQHGFPTADIAAVYGAVTSTDSDTAMLHDPEECATFLRETGCYPLFVKPARGLRGNDTHVLLGITNDVLDLPSEKTTRLTDFVADLGSARDSGILFQELLKPSAHSRVICGERLTSVRFLVVISPSGPKILSAVWRAPAGTNITDNFNCGENGNIIGGIELTTGHVQHVVKGVGWNYFPIDRHPDTDITFDNFYLPNWQEACSICVEAAGLFPGLHLQHWDIALTDRGPVVLEVNVEGGMRTHQIVQQRGIYDAFLKEACEFC